MNSTPTENHAPSFLLVEDDEAQARIVEVLLGTLGYRQYIVGTDHDAVKTVAENSHIALIIVSARLAGSEACDLVQRLRDSAGQSSLPVLLLTGRDDAAFDLEAVFALGAVDEVPRLRLTWALPAKVRFVLDSEVRSHLNCKRALVQQAGALAENHRRQSDFLATLAHELRNLLAPMRNGLELIRLADGESTELESVRRMMSRQLDHVVHLVEDLLDVTRLTHNKLTLKKERVDLHTVLDTVLDMVMPLIEANQHTLTVERGDVPLPIDADPVRIAQIVINLLNNAAKYTPPGGHIRVVTTRQCDEVHLSVCDTGIGIPEQELTSVFEMFTQVRNEQKASYDGLGVGLALVQHLLDLHGGSIDAFSAGPGQGSTFRIRLPRVAAETMPSKPDGARHQNTLPGPFRVLVVDDNADARSTFAKILDRRQHVTRQARDGEEALSVAADFRPDIIFLDIGLPDINGLDLAPQLRELAGLESVVLVALTGHANAKDHALSAAAGIDHHLNKPVNIQTVYDLFNVVALAQSQGDVTAKCENDDVILENLYDCIDTPLVALCIADASMPDLPLIAANQAFTDLTGYPIEEVIGRNCRFLQGRNREQEGRRLLANAIRQGCDYEVFLHNVKRSGEAFSNLLRLYMVRDAAGVTQYILGSQLEAKPVAQSARLMSTVASGTCGELLEQGLDDSYPARLPRRYWSLYESSRKVADEAASRLRERVAQSVSKRYTNLPKR